MACATEQMLTCLAPPVVAASASASASASFPATLPSSAANVLQGPSNSQESQTSASSAPGAFVPRLLPSSSNVSQRTDPDTQQTSPASSLGRRHVSRATGPSSSPPSPSSQPVRPSTPMDLVPTEPNTSARTSPDSTDGPLLTHASKRTASGTVKPSVSAAWKSPDATSPVAPAKGAAQDLNAARIGQLTAQLKTRLTYAMAKVQNGWETRSIDEVEVLASRSASPGVTTPSRYDNSKMQSPRRDRTDTRARHAAPADRAPDWVTSSPHRHGRTTGISPMLDGTRFNTAPLGDGVPASAVQYYNKAEHVWNQPSRPNARPATGDSSASRASSGVGTLAPAADIVPGRSSRRSAAISNVPRLVSSSSAPLSAHHVRTGSDLAAPTTPITSQPPHRPSILRMPSHQAEKDAVDTLLFLRSPHSTSHFPQNGHASVPSTAQPSPLRAEFLSPSAPVPGTKTVAFDLAQSTDSSRSSRSPPERFGAGGRSGAGRSGSGMSAASAVQKARRREEVHRMLRRVGAEAAVADELDESDSEVEIPFQASRKRAAGY